MTSASAPASSTPPRREDLLISICCADLPNEPQRFADLIDLSRRLNARYRFWEIVLVVNADEAETYLPLVHDIANLRLFKVRRSSDVYHKRVVAAEEAIGDVIVILSAPELPQLDILEMIEIVDAKTALVIGQRDGVSTVNRVLAPVARALGRGTGFRVGTRDMMTLALPRALLNRVLSYADRDLALRFPPRDGLIPVEEVLGRSAGLPRRSLRDLNRRLGLLQKLATSFAPRALFYVALLSGSVAALAIAYAIYAVITWLVRDSIAEGWLTLSLMLSFTAAFMAFATLGLSLGLQQILDKMQPKAFDDVVDEINQIDLFGQVARDLNVEVETDTAPAEPPAQGSA